MRAVCRVDEAPASAADAAGARDCLYCDDGKLFALGAEVIDLSMGQMHFHLLARFDDVGEWITKTDAESRGMVMPRLSAQRELVRVENGVTLIRVVPGLRPENTLQDDRDPLPRHVVGLGKKHASHTLRENGSPRGRRVCDPMQGQAG